MRTAEEVQDDYNIAQKAFLEKTRNLVLKIKSKLKIYL